MTSAEQLQPTMANNAPEELLQSFNQLSLTTGVSSPVPSSLSQSSSSFRRSDRSASRHELPSSPLAQHHPTAAPRRIPSSSSLRDERRGSAHSLKKRVSSSSLRAGQNPATSNSPRPSLSRKSSAQYLSSPTTGMRPKSPLIPPEMSLPAPTAASIAADYFAKELSLHQSTELNSKTIVIIQDACYGHRYSRPRTSKAGLELIVERPERMLAGVLGMAAAYVRLGKRYGRNTYAPHPDLDPRLLPLPPFQIRKTSRSMPLNSPAVTHVHGAKWMSEMKVMCDAAESRLALNGKELVRPGSSGKGGDSSQSKLHEGDLYLCSESLNAFEGALGGVCEAVDSVFGPTSTQRAFVCIRPPGHHCSADYPSGFCWLNNVHVGISYAAMTHGLTHAAILDFDLHHGDGSQAIAWEQNRKAFSAARNAAQHKKTAIGYFSLHDINSYPCEGGDEDKVRNASVCVDYAHGQSIWNVHLEPWRTTQDFWELYEKKYSVLLDKARSFLRAHTQQVLNSPNATPPKAAIFLSAGFDASEWEGVGMQRHKVNVPTDFYARFTADVVKLSQEEGLGVDGRIISVLEGGYSDRALTSGVLSHLSGLSDNRGNTISEQDGDGNRLAAEMYNRLGISNENKHAIEDDSVDAPVAFETEWWELPLLEELEALVRPPPPAGPRKSREKGAPSFFAPTQASSAKIVSPVRDRRSSNFQQLNEDEFNQPLLPEVDWATAAFELSKVLIPTDRQTLSWQHAELKAEGARARRDAANVAVVDTQRQGDHGYMQLRERKPKAPAATNRKPRSSRTSSISTRRTTIASVNELPSATAAETSSSGDDAKLASLRASRRLSLAAVATAASAPVNDRPTPRTAGPSIKNRREDSRAAKQSRPASRAASAVSSARPSPRKPPMPSRTSSRDKTSTTTRQASPSENLKKDQTQDVGGLATGMKKLRIKLNVPSPEENAIREAKAAEERKKNAPRPKASRASSSKSDSKVSRPKSAGSGQQRQQLSVQTQDDPAVPNDGDHTASHDGKISNNTNVSPEPVTIPLPAEIGDASHVFADVDFEGSRSRAVDHNGSVDRGSMPSPPLTPNQAPELTHPQITVKSPPESSSEPQRLPVFTPTSIIPFAPGQE